MFCADDEVHERLRAVRFRIGELPDDVVDQAAPDARPAVTA
jgi:hypothetical protein